MLLKQLTNYLGLLVTGYLKTPQTRKCSMHLKESMNKP